MLPNNLPDIDKSDNWLVETAVPSLVSVVVPVWNRVGLIESALDALQRQSYRPIEILVIDDGSQDGTGDVVNHWLKMYTGKHLTCRYKYQPNWGQNVARNAGVRLASGEFIQFMDSDDLVHPKKVEYAVAALSSNPDADFVVSRVKKFRDPSELQQCMGKEPSIVTYKTDPTKKPWITSMRFESWQATYRRSLLSRVGPMDDIRAGGMYPYMVRLKLHSRGGVFLPHVLNFYRVGTENAMVRSDLPLRVFSNRKSIEHIKKDLNKFGVVDESEWFNFARFAFRNYRKAVATGDKKLRLGAYTQLQDVAGAWSTTARIALTLPENVFATLFSARSAFRRRFGAFQKRLGG